MRVEGKVGGREGKLRRKGEKGREGWDTFRPYMYMPHTLQFRFPRNMHVHHFDPDTKRQFCAKNNLGSKPEEIQSQQGSKIMAAITLLDGHRVLKH